MICVPADSPFDVPPAPLNAATGQCESKNFVYYGGCNGSRGCFIVPNRMIGGMQSYQLIVEFDPAGDWTGTCISYSRAKGGSAICKSLESQGYEFIEDGHALNN